MSSAATTVDDLVARFASATGLDGESLNDLTTMLELRRDVLQAEPARWWQGDVGDLLLDVLPAKLTAEADLVAGLPELLRRYLGWLAARGVLRGAALADLLRELDQVAPEFVPAMDDPSRYGPAKSFLLGSGLRPEDLHDRERVQRAIDAYNTQIEEPDPDPIVLPPVTLAGERELRAAAADAPLVRSVVALVTHVGAGRPLTQTGALRLVDATALAAECGDERRLQDPHPWEGKVRRMADLPGVEEVFELALTAGLLYEDGRRVRVDADHPCVADELVRVGALADAALAVGPLVGEVPDRLAALVGAVSGSIPGLLAVLYAKQEPMTVDELGEAVAEELGVSGSLPVLVRGFLAQELSRLARLGMLDELGLHEPEGEPWRGRVATSVALTPLGVWWFRRVLQEAGARAPLAGELATGSARELCLGLAAGYAPDDMEAEVAAWRAARGPARAAHDLAALLGDEELICRQFAAAVLDDSAESIEAVRQVLDRERARPYAAVWLSAHGQEVPERYRQPGDAGLLFVETSAGLLTGGAEDLLVEQLRALGTSPEQVDMIRQLWRVDSPYTEEVLDAVAAHAPVAVSKAARKALHSLRSAGRCSGQP